MTCAFSALKRAPGVIEVRKSHRYKRRAGKTKASFLLRGGELGICRPLSFLIPSRSPSHSSPWVFFLTYVLRTACGYAFWPGGLFASGSRARRWLFGMIYRTHPHTALTGCVIHVLVRSRVRRSGFLFEHPEDLMHFLGVFSPHLFRTSLF